MSLAMLPRVFKSIFKNLQNFEISQLNVEGTNFIVWIPSSFSHSLLYLSQMVYKMTLTLLPK